MSYFCKLTHFCFKLAGHKLQQAWNRRIHKNKPCLLSANAAWGSSCFEVLVTYNTSDCKYISWFYALYSVCCISYTLTLWQPIFSTVFSWGRTLYKEGAQHRSLYKTFRLNSENTKFAVKSLIATVNSYSRPKLLQLKNVMRRGKLVQCKSLFLMSELFLLGFFQVG